MQKIWVTWLITQNFQPNMEPSSAIRDVSKEASRNSQYRAQGHLWSPGDTIRDLWQNDNILNLYQIAKLKTYN